MSDAPENAPGAGAAARPEHPSAAGGLVWKALSVGAAMLAAKAATTVATRGWSAVTGRPVPNGRDFENTSTRDAVAFTAISAMALAGAKVAAERGAAAYYRRSTGHLPSALTAPSKAQKKAARKTAKAAKKVEKQAARSR